jgi:Tol biopolymer transport system component
VLVAACCLGAAADAADAAFPGANGRIAFVRPGRGIWTVNPDGSAMTRVSPQDAPGVGCDSEPSFSPSGLELVFQACDPERHATAIGTMSITGLDRRTVVGSSLAVPSPQTPTFSPDGKRLAFAAGATATTRLFSIRADGLKRRRLDAVGYSPSWSATGLAFTVPLNQRRWCNSTQLDDIYALDKSLKHRRRLTKTYGSYAPDWSPDGRRIAFTRDFTVGSGDAKQVRGTSRDCKPVLRRASASYGPEIVVARANGKHAKRLTHSGGSDPSWSPDGALIGYERAGWIWTMRKDGHGAQRLVRGTQPSWQPVAVAPPS